MTGPSESVGGLTQLKPGSFVVGDGVGEAFPVVVVVGVEPVL